MCIAIYKPEGKELTVEVLRNAYSSNRDGAGFAYVEPAGSIVNIEGQEPQILTEPEICIEKGYFDFDRFLEAFEPHKLKACVIHFRIATHKNVDGKNCHPFRVNDDLVFIHNGTIGCLPAGGDNELSDTGNFNAQIVQPCLAEFPNFYLNEQFRWLVSNSIASHNKLIFLDKEARYLIIHEDQGRWDQGCWFSNTTYTHFAANFKVIVGQPDAYVKPPLALPAIPCSGTAPLEKPEGESSETQDIEPEDALSVAEMEAVASGAKEFKLYSSVEELDAALQEANSKSPVKV